MPNTPVDAFCCSVDLHQKNTRSLQTQFQHHLDLQMICTTGRRGGKPELMKVVERGKIDAGVVKLSYLLITRTR